MAADSQRAAKRQKREMPDLSIDTTNTQSPGLVVDVCGEGDTILVVQGIAGVSQPVGIRVSATALSIASSVFRRLLAAKGGGAPPSPSPGAEEARHVQLPNDDGDALVLLLNILHLRNDALPSRIPPDLLFRFVAVCVRYDCIVAAGRAASQWLDYIYSTSLKATRLFRHAGLSAPLPSATTPVSAAPPATPFSAFPPSTDSQSLFNLIEAALILNDALYFARFTSHFILTQPLITTPTSNLSTIIPTHHQQQQQQHRQQHLISTLCSRQLQLLQDLRLDFDLLIDPLAEALSEDSKHYPDTAPGEDSIHSDDEQFCNVDREGAMEFLSALRDANLWPATRWPALIPFHNPANQPNSLTSIIPTLPPPPPPPPPPVPYNNPLGPILTTLKNFRVPDHDATEACTWCTHVEDKFATALDLVRAMHKDRLWGLCLDCYLNDDNKNKNHNAQEAAGIGTGFDGIGGEGNERDHRGVVVGGGGGECRYEHFKAAGG